MRPVGVALAIAAGAWLLAADAPAADHCGKHCRCGAGSPSAVPGPPIQGGSGRLYDPDTVTTLQGTVAKVTVLPARAGRSGGLHLTLEGEGQATDVHLGPTWFLDREGLKLAKGDALEVTGSIVELDQTTVLIAREVKKGGRVLRLRDDQGVPAWAGGRQP